MVGSAAGPKQRDTYCRCGTRKLVIESRRSSPTVCKAPLRPFFDCTISLIYTTLRLLSAPQLQSPPHPHSLQWLRGNLGKPVLNREGEEGGGFGVCLGGDGVFEDCMRLRGLIRTRDAATYSQIISGDLGHHSHGMLSHLAFGYSVRGGHCVRSGDT